MVICKLYDNLFPLKSFPIKGIVLATSYRFLCDYKLRGFRSDPFYLYSYTRDNFTSPSIIRYVK